MKKLIAAVVCAALVSAFAMQAEAGEPGKIKGSLLNKMGLGQAKVMTAAEGDQVRGSFAIAGGIGTANLLGSSQTTGYLAAFPTYATGSNGSQVQAALLIQGPVNVFVGLSVTATGTSLATGF